MPVRYDIAAQVPQYGGGFDPMNMFAQMQTMDYRQRQNALAEMQMAEYQRKLQADMATRALGGEAGFNIADPRLVGRAVQLGGLEEGVRVANYQRQMESLKASEAAQRAAAANQASEADIRRQRFEAEKPGLLAKASKEQLDKSMSELSRLREVAGNVLQNNGKGFDELRKFGEGTGWDAMIGDKYDPERIRALATQAATVQEYLKPHIDEVAGKKGQIRLALAPGQAPVFTETMVQDVDAGNVPAPTVYAPGKEPMQGRLVTEGLPTERRPALLTQRQATEKVGREQSSQIFGELSGIFTQLAKRGTMPSVSMTPSESLRAVSAGSRAGQEVARVLDPESQRLRDEASATIDQWIQTKRQSGSISAQEANTIDELERLKSMLGSPRMTIEAVQNILSRADRYSGLGKLKGYEPSEEEKKGVIDARKLTTGGGAAARPPLSSFFGK
jgi:hypothetical protein